MKMLKFFNIFILFISISIHNHFGQCDTQAQYEANIKFYGYASNGSNFLTNFNNNVTLLEFCDPNENYTIIVHGWTESIYSIWVQNLKDSFVKARQGCVFVMDYSIYSVADYFTLLSNFFGIQAVLTRKLRQFDELGFNPDNALLFGFSFGSHLVFEAAYQYGPRKIARADCCDPAASSHQISVTHAKDAAKDVQCIHTSSDIGTINRYCQKNVNMGNCGLSQPAALIPPFVTISHFMCPVIYVNAFDNDFKMVTTADVYQATMFSCASTQVVDITKLGPLVMGFRMNMSVPNGDYYSLTRILPPYNVL